MFEVDGTVMEELQNGSDRACAIAGHAHIEQLLPEILKRHLVQSPDDWNILYGGSDGSGSIRSHGTLIRLAYLTGLIGFEFKNDLVRLKNVRNAFAHRTDVSSFDHGEVAKPISKLEFLSVGIAAEGLASGSAPSSRRRYEIAIGEAAFLLKQRVSPAMPSPVLFLPA